MELTGTTTHLQYYLLFYRRPGTKRDWVEAARPANLQSYHRTFCLFKIPTNRCSYLVCCYSYIHPADFCRQHCWNESHFLTPLLSLYSGLLLKYYTQTIPTIYPVFIQDKGLLSPSNGRHPPPPPPHSLITSPPPLLAPSPVRPFAPSLFRPLALLLSHPLTPSPPHPLTPHPSLLHALTLSLSKDTACSGQAQADRGHCVTLDARTQQAELMVVSVVGNLLNTVVPRAGLRNVGCPVLCEVKYNYIYVTK